ncbi:hypothetical protein [Stutzerimonas stutzeri]|uniref:hypothetical protein n=1 Tax=Stutzerimonas stutzeri TaxID=316 RepID=UPI0015E42896|nr:hypothetical protein [Stutzerimonas stutzeri]MBA1280263.1 hypothetical protein [Stutzerimonas stutzeri]
MSKQTPKIYSAKLSPAQNAALERYESVCGMEPFGIDEFDAGEISAYQLWRKNLSWLESVWGDVQNIHFPVPLEEAMVDD